MAEQHEVSELTKQFLHALMLYLKQRGAELTTAILVDPLRKMAGKIGLGCAGITFVCLGVVFLGMFMVHGFARLLGGDYVYGFLASAAVVLILGALSFWLMSRAGKGEAKKRGKDSGGTTGHD